MQEAVFLKAMTETAIHEAGYADHPDDRGGATMYGITEQTARAHGFSGPMKDLGWDFALAIYYDQYWVKPGWCHLAERNPALAIALFDASVNHGPNQAGRFLQEAINILNLNQKITGNLKVDGICGPATRAALEKVQGVSDLRARAVLWQVTFLRGVFYRDLIRGDESQEAFALGWINRLQGAA